MKFNEHSTLAGQHAFLSASKYSWLNYSEEKLATVYRNAKAAELGTRLHALAAEHIRLKIRMPKNNMTFNRYVNDAIGYSLVPEQVLYYSPVGFGTADAISFDEKKGFLRIHDLKTGVTKVHPEQLYIYNALFCLEYGITPGNIGSELRIYQNDEIYIYEPTVDQIAHIMDQIVFFDRIIEEIKAE